jgi:hypothetical protein
MNYVHGIFVVNRPDLLEIALNSVKPLWPHAFIMDNSPGGHLGKEHSWPVPVVRPSVPLSYSQSMNYLHRIAKEKGADVFGVQHNDAEALGDGAERFIETATAAYHSDRKWATVMTSYDIISAYNMKAAEAIGAWDTNFPQPNYHIDTDWFHRARINGYELIESGVAVKHHNESSSTLKSDPDYQRWHKVKFGMNETYYIKKWGGKPHEEKFPTPWNQPV